MTITNVYQTKGQVIKHLKELDPNDELKIAFDDTEFTGTADQAIALLVTTNVASDLTVTFE